MSLYSDLGLDRTVRVALDGSIERGIEVPHMLDRNGDERYMLASVPPKARRARRFAPSGIPAGVNENLPCNIPDCEECEAIRRGVRHD